MSSATLLKDAAYYSYGACRPANTYDGRVGTIGHLARRSVGRPAARLRTENTRQPRPSPLNNSRGNPTEDNPGRRGL